jgi:Mce-associated membrane protein
VRRALPAVALVLVTSACTVTGTAVPVPGAGNLAVVDGPGTAAALAAVKVAAEAVFSYDSTSPAGHDQATGAYLTGDAKKQLAALFEQIGKSPNTVHLTTHVRQSAALELTGNRVRELAVLEQVNGTTKGLATVAFTALKTDGRWRISDIAVSPAQPPPAPQPDDGSPAGLRDAALAGVRTIADALFTTDSADPVGTFARAEAVTADPLRSDYRKKRSANLDAIHKSGVKVTLGPNPMAGVTALSGGRASVLFFTTLQVTKTAGQVTGQPFTAELEVVRAGKDWKAIDVRTISGA